ncbi:hypothetical protein KUD11_09260 [Roseovarius sp. LXJ103]|uniref:hypothetical protein n=1 Tax=Roseovarius carneus TaxID=2853164 RepID=UPI0011B26EFE|nr:hypothetical protein [Roseovarius carneus]MBZ8118836.1 hypothetical protein [Roseovarius carneus]
MRLRQEAYPAPDPVAPEGGLTLINHLRVIGLRCRAAREAAPLESCALIGATDDTARALHAETLMRALPHALGHAPVLYRPGSAALSFDEAWIMQLARALASGDMPSAEFLLRSRVPLHARRSLSFLLRSVSEHFTLI